MVIVDDDSMAGWLEIASDGDARPVNVWPKWYRGMLRGKSGSDPLEYKAELMVNLEADVRARAICCPVTTQGHLWRCGKDRCGANVDRLFNL